LCGSSCIKCRRASGGNLGFDPRPAKLADKRRRRREAVRANGPNPSPWGRHLIQGSVPGTQVTVCSDQKGYTFAWNGSSIGASRQVSAARA
jgi:hypothetical protein